MVFLLGVNLPDSKAVHIALTSIYGIGRATATKLTHELGIHKHCRMSQLSEDQLTKISQKLNNMKIEAELKRDVQIRITNLINIGCYRGLRHRAGLPVHGQRTRTNAYTARKLNKGRIGQQSRSYSR